MGYNLYNKYYCAQSVYLKGVLNMNLGKVFDSTTIVFGLLALVLFCYYGERTRLWQKPQPKVAFFYFSAIVF